MIITLLAALIPFVVCFAPRAMPAVLIVAAAIALVHFIRNLPPKEVRGVEPADALFYKLIIGFVMLIAFSALWSASPRAPEMLRDVLLVSMCSFIVWQSQPSWPATLLPRLWKGLCAGGALALSVFFLNEILNFPLHRWWLGLPNEYNFTVSNVAKRSEVLVALFAWPIALYVAQRNKRHALLLLATIIAMSFFFTSRSAMLALVAGAAHMGLALWRAEFAKAIGFIILPLAFILILAGALVTPHLPWHSSNPAFDSGGYRLQIWNYAARQTMVHLPFGIGLDGSRVLPQEGEASTQMDGDLLPVHPHNAYLHVWLELGILGAALASAILWFAWRRITRASATLQPFLWGYAATATIALATTYGLWQTWWMAGHALALILLAQTVKEEKNL